MSAVPHGSATTSAEETPDGVAGPSARRRVVFVLSFRHSGSTIVGRVLGSSTGTTYVGESDAVLRRASKGGTCTCGRPVAECFGLGPEAPFDPATVRRATRQSDPLRSLVPHLAGLLGVGRTRLPQALQRTAAAQRDVWRGRPDGVTVIDSSKSLRLIAHHCSDPSIDTTVVALRRDPRDAVNSCLRKASVRKLNGRGAISVSVSGIAETIRWAITDLWIRRVVPAVDPSAQVIAYDAWAEDPQRVTGVLCGRIGVNPPEIVDRSVRLPGGHVVWGNQGAGEGDATIRPGERDRTHLPRPVSALATALTRVGFSVTG